MKGNVMSAGRRYTLLLVAIAALGAGFVLLRGATYGVSLHFDSTTYLSGARKLLAGEGFTFSWHPPLYPTLLAAAGFLAGLDPQAVAEPLNALMFGMTILVAGHWLRQRITSRVLALWGCLAVAAALHMTAAMSWILSEPAFVLCVTLTLFFMDRHLIEDKGSALIWAAIFAALACMTRNIGLILVITLLPLPLLQPGTALLEKMKRGAVFALIAIMPVSLWMLRNLSSTGYPFGTPPLPRGITLHRTLNVLLIELTEWIRPNPAGGQWYAVTLGATALGLAALGALAAGAAFALIRTYRKPELWHHWSSFCLHGGFALVYFISIAAASKFWGIDIGWGTRRFWIPAYIPLLFALIFLLDRGLIWLRRRTWAESAAVGALARVGAILLFIWLGHNVWLNRLAIIRANDSEAGHFDKGYAAPAWRDNDVVQFVRAAQLEGAIFSNSPASLYIHTNPANDIRFPSQKLWRLQEKINEAEGDVHLVFFNDTIPVPPRTISYLAELEALPEFELLAQLDSGVVFRVNRDQADKTGG